MTRKRRNILLIACGLLVMAVVLVTVLDREPSYRDRPLSAWVSDIPTVYNSEFSSSLNQKAKPAEEDARSALRHLGTNAIPHLMKWTAYEQPAWKNNLFGRANRLWEAFGVTNKFSDKKQDRGDRAAEAFKQIEPLSDDTFARLGILMTKRNWHVSFRASSIIREAGGLSTGALIILLNHNSADVRQMAVIDLGGRKDATRALPLLIERLNDKSSGVATWAAIRLGEIRAEPALVLPALTHSLRHKSPEVRSAAACALGKFGSDAVPILLTARNDPDFSVRTNVHLALSFIQPRAAESTSEANPERHAYEE